MLKGLNTDQNMTLTITHEETHRMAKELARLTGESITVAVEKAVRERLRRVKSAKRLLRIGKECAAQVKEPFKSMDHAEFLYDEKGLPK